MRPVIRRFRNGSKSGFCYAETELPKNLEKILRERLAKLADKLGLTEQMHNCLKKFGRNFDTAHPERIRQALTDAFLLSRANKGVGSKITKQEKEVIRTICETAGLEFNAC